MPLRPRALATANLGYLLLRRSGRAVRGKPQSRGPGCPGFMRGTFVHCYIAASTRMIAHGRNGP
eukprot:2066525-Pyramimonas_sp.AAC.1